MRFATWLGIAALGFALGGQAHAENIKIGFMVPYSGANADLGAVQDKAIDLYMKLHAKDIAPHTVEWHVRHLIEKLEVHSKLQAVIAAARLGLIDVTAS